MDPTFCCPVRGAVHVCEWGAKGNASLVARLASGNARDAHDADDWYLHVDSDVELNDVTVPFGEFCLGTHPRHPALVLLPSPRSGPVSTPLVELLKGCPNLAGSRRALAPAEMLPFVLKVLSVDRPTPLRVRPGSSSPHAHHRDPYARPSHEPELLVAVGPCELLAGLARIETVVARVEACPEILGLPGCSDRLAEVKAAAEGSEQSGGARSDAIAAQAPLRALVRTLLGAPRGALIAAFSQLGARLAATADGMAPRHERLCAALHEGAHPNDGACLAPFLLKLHELQPGEALAIPPGEPSTILRGDVLCCAPRCEDEARAGLTDQPCDLGAFCSLLTCTDGPLELLAPEATSAHATAFSTRVRARAGGRGPPSEAGHGVVLTRCAPPAGETCLLPAVDAPALLLVVSGSGVVDESAHAPFSPSVRRAAWPGLALFVPAGRDVRLAASAVPAEGAGVSEQALPSGQAEQGPAPLLPSNKGSPFLAFHCACDAGC